MLTQILKHPLSVKAVEVGKREVEAELRAREKAARALEPRAVQSSELRELHTKAKALRGMDLPPEALDAALAALDRRRADLVAAGDVCKDPKRSNAKDLMARAEQIAAELAKLIQQGMKALSDPHAVTLARESLKKLIVGEQIVLTPDANHSSVSGEVQFVSLGEHLLQLAGMRRSVGKAYPQDLLVAGAGFEPATFGL